MIVINGTKPNIFRMSIGHQSLTKHKGAQKSIMMYENSFFWIYDMVAMSLVLSGFAENIALIHHVNEGTIVLKFSRNRKEGL